MAAPNSTLPNDEKESQDSRYNPGQQINREKLAGKFGAGEMDQIESFANDPSNHDGANGVRKGEEEPAGTDPEIWDNKVNGSNKSKKTTTQKFRGFMRKRGAIITVLSMLGIGGGVLAGFAGPTSVLVAAMENMTSQNDSSTTSMERRFMKVLGYAMTGDPICAKSAVSIKCKMGKISNSALTKLESKGIKPVFTDTTTNTGKRTGYPSENPTHYDITTDTGKVERVESQKLTQYLSDNPKIEAKVLGTGGVFNARIQAWTGKYITKRFFDPFNLKKDGGIADGENRKGTAEEKLSATMEKLKSKIPGIDKLSANNDFNGKIKEKVTGRVKAAKKGGAAYTIAVGGCVAVKAPGLIAGGIAGLQLAEELPYVTETLISPADKLKASGVDKTVKFTGDDADATGSVLTTKAKSSDGSVGAPIESDILLSTLGINKNKPAISKNLTPGYSALTNPIVTGSNAVEAKTENACNAIMSPAAMYSAMAVDSAITVAASATVIGGIVKVAAGFAIAEAATAAVSSVVDKYAGQILTTVAKNDAIPKAQGKDLGDVIGLAGLSYFSGGGMAHGLPTLKQSQVPKYLAMRQQVQDRDRQMDVASLSPFDTSSQYTFLGSIVHNFGIASIAGGATSGGIFSQLLGYIKSPLTSITTSANAENFSTASCGYAADFKLTTENPDDTPAINAAGMPCTGLTSDMSTGQALDLIENEGWFDYSKDYPDGATIDDLVSSGYIVADTPLTDYIASCTDATSGDYIFNAAGCTIDTNTKDPNSVASGVQSNANCSNGSCANSSDTAATAGLKNPQSLEAIPVFMSDFIQHQSTNGEDELTSGSSTNTTDATAGATIDQAHIYDDSTGIACATGTKDAGIQQGYLNGKEVDVRVCSIPNTADNGPDSAGEIRVNSRISGAALALVNSIIGSDANKNGNPMRVADSFRTMEGQKKLYAQYGSPRAAAPGYSNHQMGLAIDFQLGSNNGATRPGDPLYDYLVSNASKYGFAKLTSEAWHWQPQAAQGSLGQ